MKTTPSKVVYNWPKFFFYDCQPAQNQPKSQFLFHKNCSLHDFFIMTLNAGYGALWLADAALPYIVGGVIFLLWLGFTVEMFIF